MKYLLFFSVVLFYHQGYSQDLGCAIDSLKNRAEKDLPNTELAELNLTIGKCYLQARQPDSAIVYTQLALDIATKSDQEQLRAQALYFLGTAYYDVENGLEAIECYNQALEIPNGLTNDLKINTYNKMGVVYMVFEEPAKGIDYFNEALLLTDKARQETGQTYEFLYNNKGIVFAQMGLFDSAKFNHKRCLTLRLEQNNDYAIGQSYNNIGTLFYDEEKYDSALFYLERGLLFRSKWEDAPLSSIQESEVNIAKTLIELGNYSKARKLLIKVENQLDIQRNSTIELRTNKALMQLHAATNNYKNAYETSLAYFKLKDSIFGIEKREELIRINIANQYNEQKLQDSLMNAEEVKRQEIEQAKEDEIQAQKDHSTKIIQIGLIIALLLMIVIIVIVYRNYRSKKRTSEAIQEQKGKLELVHQEITDSITYAKRIQNTILPSDKVVKEALMNQFILYLPKAIVAGDFYWVRQIDNYIYFTAADCTGHGVPGALVSIICSNALNRSIEEFSLRQPGEILDKVTALLIEAFVQNNQEVKDGMDLSLCCWDKSTGKIWYAGANNPLYIVKTKNSNSLIPENSIQNEKFYLEEVKGNKQAVGWQDNHVPFTTVEINADQGDLIYSFTDGFPDQFGGPRGKKYKYRQFKQFLLKIAEYEPHKQHELLLAEFQAWKDDLEQVDDVCIIGVKV